MVIEWKTCPKCQCCNKNRGYCQDCGLDLRLVEPDKESKVQPTPKHSAIASILWQWHDEMKKQAAHWRDATEDPHGISTAVYAATMEQADCLSTVLVRNFGERQP